MDIQEKLYQIKMSDGSEWRVPLYRIALNRATFYRSDYENSLEKSFENTWLLFEQAPDAIEYWSKTMISWKEIKEWAFIYKPADKDYTEDWKYGEAEIVEPEDENGKRNF